MAEYSCLENYISVHKLYPDAYLASWSAASYWGIMDEVSCDLIFFSPTTEIKTEQQGIPVQIIKVPENLCTATKKQFDETGDFFVSSPEKTIIDCFLYPDLAGGERQVFSILARYRLSEFYNQKLLIIMAKKFLSEDKVSLITQFLKEGDFDD